MPDDVEAARNRIIDFDHNHLTLRHSVGLFEEAVRADERAARQPDALRAALELYGQHLYDCADSPTRSHWDKRPHECTCGLTAILDRFEPLRAALHPTEAE